MGKNDNSTTDQKLIEERWLGVEEIAAYLGVSKDSVSRWIDQGLPAHKLGRLWKFKAAEVDVWVKSEKGKTR